MSRISTAAIIFAIALMTAHTTHAAEISTDYVDGLWSLDGKEACGTDNYEYVALRADGVVETGDDGRPHGAGFWELEDGEMTFHLSTSPAFHRDDLEGVGGVYDNFDIRVITYNVEADQFGAIGLLGKEVARATFTRCP